MELTPISVPSKRSRWADHIPRHERVAKRLKKTPATTKALAKPSKRTRRGKVSYLEACIPYDILRTIFMYSENINFVRASPLIGKFLSAIETRREVFVYAFAPTWCAKGPTGDTMLNREANPDFQSKLLEFSWVNVRFITESFARCGRVFPKFMEGRDIFGDLNLAPDAKDVKDVVKDDAAEMNSAERYFMDHYATFMGEDRIVDKALLTRDMDEQISMVHSKTCIPEALITGPWDDEALKKFYWLVRSGARYQDHQTWELGFNGLEMALGDCDKHDSPGTSALVLLRDTISWTDWTAYQLDDAYQLIYPLEVKASWLKKYSVNEVLCSVRSRIVTASEAAVT